MKQLPLKSIHLIAGPLLFIIVYFWDIPTLSHEGKAVLAGTLWTAYWWITEAVELPVTSLIPIIIFPLSGALSLEQTTSSYGNPFIFLFLGGFLIGLAIEKWNLHKRIAYQIIRSIGTSEKRVLLGFMVSTAFVSMWISNTATTIMMLPIGVSVISQFRNSDRFARNLMLGIAYAASIGGMATLIGTPPNIILAGVIKESLKIDLSFSSWMVFATPFSLLLLLICWWYLSRGLEKKKDESFTFNPDPLERISVAEKRVLVVFCFVAFLWITRTFIWNRFIPALDDSIIAMFGGLVLFIIPSGNNEKLLDWKTARKLPWDVLLLFGGGLAIAKGFSKTDLTTWLAGHFSQIHLAPAIIMLIIIASINFLTEITSNTATASIMLPLLYSLSVPMKIDSLSLLAGGAIAASCAFMLPVATPPNAIVFSSGKIKIGDMMRTGFFMNIASILLIYVFVEWMIGVLK